MLDLAAGYKHLAKTGQFEAQPNEVDHWTPYSHQCAGCWRWVVDCEHLQERISVEHHAVDDAWIGSLHESPGKTSDPPGPPLGRRLGAITPFQSPTWPDCYAYSQECDVSADSYDEN